MISSNVMAFLKRSSKGLTDIYRPTWLKNNPDDECWEVVFDLNPNTVKKSDRYNRPQKTVLHWGVRLLEGDLLSKPYAILLQHMKLLLIAFIDLGVAPSRTPVQIRHFHKSLLLLAVQCDSMSVELTMSLGFAVVDDALLLDLLAKFQAHGTEGVWEFRSKWDKWIQGELNQECIEELLRWGSTGLNAGAELLRARDKGVKSLDPAEIPVVPQTINVELAKQAKLMLLRRGAFDANGFLKSTFVAHVLGVDASRVVQSAPLLYHLRQYELASDYRLSEFRKFGVRTSPIATKATLAERATSEEGYLTQTLANGILLISRAATLVIPLANSSLAQTSEIEDVLESFPHCAAARTASVPLKCGLELIRLTTEWEARYGSALVDLLNQISSSFTNSDGKLIERLGSLAKQRMQIPEASPLQDFLLSEFWGHAHRTEVATWSGSARRPGSGVEWRKSLAVCDLVEIYTATAFVLTTLFACCRKQEVLELTDSDIIQRNGRWYLNCYLRKRVVDGVRKKVAKPIPNIVARCLCMLIAMRNALLKISRNRLPPGGARVFFRFTRSAVVDLKSAELYHMLDMLSEFHGLTFRNGVRWHVRPHQLRRFFAMTFFHYGGKENSLPALSWFMGHEGDVERTWRYIMEEMRGEEISIAEASMAALAVYSEQESNAAEALRRLLLQHFDVESLDVMNENEVESYLAYLHAQGIFSAKPICIRTAHGLRYDVMILIRSEADAASR